ncbi:helix-turn-helix transcriptional regulator [Nitrospirillum sp. BR 11163]|uniref:helix-turn-helix transcriptional regulator n=1 Tax=Nitrospirillum sp. BR 11163 TaxID=3104323 RepID=UPI002AFF01AC|nr:LuxR C-terminal-related transcriptional regulator [Nitrospirillum sp. BR 11163]MEA1676011.1 LuxR C-terminal-related transcriptional regulator [Nitrospirillum sp. BR 11163]
MRRRLLPQRLLPQRVRAALQRRADWLPAARRVALYGLALAIGTAALQWLDYQRLARAHSDDIYILLIAAAFLALGVMVGMRLMRPAPPLPAEGNVQAQAGLGISAREMAVLRELAAGRSNKEIALVLDISPNTVKTHLARLFEKLGAQRRTDAVNRARELGLVP